MIILLNSNEFSFAWAFWDIIANYIIISSLSEFLKYYSIYSHLYLILIHGKKSRKNRYSCSKTSRLIDSVVKM